jgi:spermidine/putrescine transport system substrate-binding protein
MRSAAVGAGALGLSSLLAACGLSPSGGGASPTQDWQRFWSEQTLHDQLNLANWPSIDTHKGDHPTLQMFTKQTGITVDSRPVINDNQAFSGKIQPPDGGSPPSQA